MHLNKSKVFRLYCAISEDEAPRFRDFLATSMLSEQGLVGIGFGYFKQYREEIEDGEDLTLDFFGVLFPGQVFLPSKLRKTMNRMVLAIKNFWYFDAIYGKDPEDLDEEVRYLQKIELMRQLIRRNLFAEFQFERKNLLKQLDHARDREFELWIRQALCLLDLEVKQKTNPRKARPELEAFETMSYQLFTRQLFRIRAVQLNQKRITGDAIKGLEIHTKVDLAPFISKDSDSQAYRLYIDLELRLGEVTWSITMQRWETLLPNCSHKAKKEVMELMLSYAIRRRNEGLTEGEEQIWEAYHLMFTEHLLGEDGDLPMSHFINLVQLGILRQENAFLTEMVRKYQGVYEHSQAASTLQLAKGIILKSKGNWEEAETEFTKVLMGSDFVIEQLIARANIFQVHFEKGEFYMLMDEKYPAYRMALQRKIQKARLPVKNILHFIRLVTRLAKLAERSQHHETKTSRFLTLRMEVENCEELLNRDWLLEKLDQFLA